MRKTQTTALAVTVCTTLALAGCGTADRSASAAASGSPGPGSVTVQDSEVCSALSDVMTVVDNADSGLADGRMAEQERDGWYRLATRVLDRIPGGDDAVLSQGLADLRATAPPVDAGTRGPTEGIGSPAWHDALASVADTCAAADAELTVESFSGG